MVPAYGASRRSGASGPWSMLRPGPRSALPRELTWLPLGPADNLELAQLIARAESVDNPPYRTTAVETSEYFLDPTYSGVAGRDSQGVMRAFALVRLRPARELYASMTGVVDPDWRGRGVGGALMHWQTERARHLIGAERAGHTRQPGADLPPVSTNPTGIPVAEAQPVTDPWQMPAHIVTTVLEGDEEAHAHLVELGFSPKRWYRELRRSLDAPVPQVEVDGFIHVEPWSHELDEATWHAHNQAIAEGFGGGAITLEEWRSGRTYFEPRWSFVALDRSGDRSRVAGYLISSKYEQDWPALGWREGYTDMLGVLGDYRTRNVAQALLVAAMAAYTRDGMDYAATGVDSDNPTGAVDLYDTLGYTPTQGTVLYNLDV